MSNSGVQGAEGRSYDEFTPLHDVLFFLPMQKSLACSCGCTTSPRHYSSLGLPLLITRMLARTCLPIFGRRAEVALTAFFVPFVLGRYADMLVNIGLCVFPKVFSVASEPSTEEYSVACKAIAANPFNMNPIFCLRSKAHLQPGPPLHLLQLRQGGLVEGLAVKTQQPTPPNALRLGSPGTGVLWGMPPSAAA
mmetsp:Transcript_123672/g.395184  ORF Transcript_123672/g.395184 Transcript_123672/m.395184 type:complete len:193 (-) Transcript_123672:62-640(-)